MSLLCLGAGRLRPRIGRLEPTRRHTYLLYDEGVRHSKQGAQWVGCWGLADGGVMTGMVITCKMLSSTFFAMDTMALQAAVGTLCTDSSSYSITCPLPLPISLLVMLVIA